jgi:hypothetical protein
MSKIGALRDLLVGLLEEHERDGAIPTSARFLYYELVQRGQLSKQSTGKHHPDQIVHDALTDLRREGRVPWDWIVDELSPSRSLALKPLTTHQEREARQRSRVAALLARRRKK